MLRYAVNPLPLITESALLDIARKETTNCIQVTWMAAILLLELLCCAYSEAANFWPFATRNGTVGIAMEGEILADDWAIFSRHVANANQAGQRVTVLQLNSPGGNLFGGYALAIAVRDLKVETYVGADKQCASACFIIFAAGQKRTASPDARVGVHSIHEVAHGETAYAKSKTIDMARVLQQLHVPPHIIGLAVTTPPSNMRWLSPEELKYMGVTVQSAEAEDKSYLKQVSYIVRGNSGMPQITNSDKKRARELNKQGIVLINSERYAEAIGVLAEAMKLDSFNAEILGNLGYALYHNGQYALARDTLSLSLKIKPTRGASWNNLGLALAELVETDWAEECFINYYNYSSKKDIAGRQLHIWAEDSKSSAYLRRATSNAIDRLGI